ncbi:heavy-metal-associated domain-containing protein [Tessaracoccus sp. SD287]|uniref:heavy-metal-associated domain-containing protein n=1 Tax=Tessaracoccus sp. SD287 TaxID=2782008 RepID=UPI001A961065|nr:cation transporter [Tessaracoccus sp. SD287]MBO1030610.1 heavy-metal-associated domain-containing protein [Tessaracoccus sp. SD287]
MISTYTVTGMTCGHCVSAVTEEVSAVAGVDQVDVQLEGGTMSVTSADAVDFDAIKAAVAEAGDQYVVQPA